VQALADSIPGATFENLNGLMQLHFGFPTLGIPPFDPSLPRLDLPGPEEAFSDSIHLTAEGYLLFADELFERFYGPALGSEVEAVPALPEAAGWILGLLLVATRAPSRAYMRRSARGRASAPSSAASL
jgi:hypothetical protein